MPKVPLAEKGLGFGLSFDLVAEFISPPKSAHFQFYRGREYPKKCKVYSFSYYVEA